MIIFKLDELVPCLKDMETGDIYDTEVIRIRRKSVLSHYNKRTGWYINWSKFPESTEVYALVLKGTNDIQGMIAVEYNDEFQAVHVVWGCVAPQNNVWEYGKKKFSGVGGHLFAIASELSLKHGYDGFLYADEISSLNLSNVNLVVLSACQSGLGNIANSEGVFGLQRGFKLAGAHSIIMSLWKVDDTATQKLMTQFYKYVVSGMKYSEALTEAQNVLRLEENGKYDAPRYWAAFVLLDGI